MINNYDVLIKFYTPSGIYIDAITMQPTNPLAIDLDINFEKKGGLTDFTLKVQRDFNFRIFNQMFMYIYINQILWCQGIMNYIPIQDSNETMPELVCNGFIKQLEKTIINVTYSSQTILQIITDIFTNQIVGETDILWDAGKVVPPNVTLTTYEAKDKAVSNVLSDLLDICNISYDSDEYKYYVDENRYFCFDLIDKTTIQENFFEGTDFQDAKIEQKTDKLVNQINLYKNNANSQQVVFDSMVNDANSIALYNLAEQKLTLPSNMDTTTAQRFATYRIARWGKPRKNIKLKNLQINDSPFIFGQYNITTKHQLNTFILDECNDLATWTVYLPSSTITIDKSIMYSGRCSFKWSTTVYNSDYIELDLPEPIWFWESIILYIRPENLNCEYQVNIEDKDGNQLNTDYFICEQYLEHPDYLVLENDVDYFATNSMFSVFKNITLSVTHNNEFIALENGVDTLITEDNNDFIIDGLMVVQNKMVLNDFNAITILNNNKLTNFKKIKLASIGSNTESYLDRVEIQGRMFSTNNLTLTKIKYSIVKNQILADAEFGEIEENAVDKIKSIQDKQIELFNIFEKH